MPTPSSGTIAFSDIAWIVYNNYASQVSLNDPDVRSLSGVSSGQISLTNAYNKPTAGNTGSTYYTPGSYSWVVVPYETLVSQVAGGGGGGGGACSGEIFYYGCVNPCSGTSGSAGSQSTFNGVIAYGGGGGVVCGATGSNGGNNQNANTGGGGTAGARGTAGGNCNQVNGGLGGQGGYVQVSWRKGSTGPNYGSTINFSVGAGGAAGRTDCRGGQPGAGGAGWVYVSWS